MSASSAASSSLSRARTPIIILTGLAAAFGIYYLHSSNILAAETPVSSTNLHRSNAIHRRRRRSIAPRDDGTSLFVEEPAENDEDAQIVARQLEDGETVVDLDQAYQDDYSWEEHEQQPPRRTGQNIVQLLFRVSEDATRRNAYVHRGCACNGCGVVPIRGIRYRCANCADYDLCEGCESQGLHTKTHIFYKIRVPAPSFGPRHIQPVWYSGDPENTWKMLPKELIAKLSRETGFERPELDAYWEQWTFMANTDWRDDPDDINLAMDRKTFERCLVPSGGYRHAAPSLIFDRMFAFYDTNKDDLISFPEFLHGLAYRKKRDKWTKIFEGYDIDGDGYVDRKDFLRMFRSYYVLYRQMHRDMLEGMDEQQMSSTDAHRLVSGRQPLSSAFGQDGRYPPAPDPRAGEGKTVLSNGDWEITDGKGVINDSADDTGDREDIFKADLPTSSPWKESIGYWEAQLNPPVSVEQMPEVLRNLNRRSGNSHPILGIMAAEQDDSSSDTDDSFKVTEWSDADWPPQVFRNVTDEDAEAICGPGTTVAQVPQQFRSRVCDHAVKRERAHREIYERWKRRHFYTDEEEGATPPADWKEDDDILVHAGIEEDSKEPVRPRAHSRSSSKVRFAEEIDDFDTRSNPSTSSRSVPERWGGMEIPDAEKDAGKEILYQVTQQAFNELLDPLFKAKEDLALEAAETKADRMRYGHLFNSVEFETWALEKEREEEGKEKTPKASEKTQNSVWPSFPEVEVEEVRERPLEELLEATGYEVAAPTSISEPSPQPQEMPSWLEEVLEENPGILPETQESLSAEAERNSLGREQPSVLREIRDPSSSEADHGSIADGPFPLVEEISNTLNSLLPEANPARTASPTEVLSIIAQYSSPHTSTSPRSSSPQHTPSSPDSSDSDIENRDPTLPQFRPNSHAAPTPPLASNTNLHERAQSLLNLFNAPNINDPDQELSMPLTPRTYALLNPSNTIPEADSALGQRLLQAHAADPNFGLPLPHPSSAGPKDKRLKYLTAAVAYLHRPRDSDFNFRHRNDIWLEQLLKMWRAERAEKEKMERGGWGRLSKEEWMDEVSKAVRGGRGGKMDYLGAWIEFCLP
jgi:Ca2+-binding EF-hand superfamily protein